MLIEKKTIDKVDIRGRSRKINVVVLECDQCKKVFEKYECMYNDELNVYCNKDCWRESMKNGVTRRKTHTTIGQKYGANAPISNPEIREKARRTCQKRYGVDHQMHRDCVKKKIRETCLVKYGSINPFQCEKSKETLNYNYGVNNPAHSAVIIDKMKKNYQQAHGVDHPLKDPLVREKIQATCLERFGTTSPLGSSEIHEKGRQTLIAKYGVDHPMKVESIKEKFDYHEIAKKSHATMKKNHTYHRSLGEDSLCKILQSRFGTDAVQTQSPVKSWSVDFYVATLDTYIEFDGVYWHGLDRPLSEIAKHQTKRDVVIHKKWTRDREFDQWCLDNGKRLVRVTDLEFNVMKKKEDFGPLWERLGVEE